MRQARTAGWAAPAHIGYVTPATEVGRALPRPVGMSGKRTAGEAAEYHPEHAPGCSVRSGTDATSSTHPPPLATGRKEEATNFDPVTRLTGDDFP